MKSAARRISKVRVYILFWYAGRLTRFPPWQRVFARAIVLLLLMT